MEAARARARRLAQEHLDRGDPTGWFEPLYASAEGDAGNIQWADLAANPGLVAWLDRAGLSGVGKRALTVGCGLGDDAEELARRGFEVVAFDISSTAIAWCRRRFPGSSVAYCVADLFASPVSWEGAFDFVLEAYTLQVLPPNMRRQAMARLARYVTPGGTLLAIARGREADDDPGKMPWPLTREELAHFQQAGLQEHLFEDYGDQEDPPVRRFRVEYRA